MYILGELGLEKSHGKKAVNDLCSYVMLIGSGEGKAWKIQSWTELEAWPLQCKLSPTFNQQ